MKCNKRLKYCNYVAFSHFHGTAVNNSGLVLEKAIRDEKIVLSDTEIVYAFKNKLKEWLVNDIRVTFNENNTIVNVPIGYEKYFRNL